MRNTKLELTWVGKGEDPILEPRILIEDPEKSYGDKDTGNMLIKGDNLLALKALEQDYTGKIKCIYIDPPFNTGNAFEHYEDGLEHSIWINLMNERLKILKSLLRDDGFIFIHLDHNEIHYAKVLMDEIFGRNNFINHVSMTTNDPSGFKATSAKIFSTANHLLIYSASQNSELNKMWVSSEYDSNYDKVLFNKLEHYKEWEFKSIKEVVLNKLKYSSLKEFQAHFGKYSKEILNLYIKDFAYENPDIVFRTAAISGGAKAKRIATINLSKNKRNVVFTHPDDDLKYFYILNGEQIIFYSKRFVFINNLKQPSRALTNMWTDIRYTGIAKEGNVNFKNAKKPEKLIERVLTLGSNEGDLVLDSFLGSGTTAAVAHKMNRKYIGIELGEHCDTHCLPRLKQVVDGTDQGGISKTVNWQGGGGLRYYNLAPSLLKKDHRDNYIINPEYNAEMLAAAMAKHEGFTYSPCSKHYWKQGFSTETDYIFVTTQSVTVKLLDQVYSEMGENESLLVCCKAYSSACKDKYPNITIKKIPKMIQDRCEFGKEDYSLHIVDSPLDELRIESEPLDEVTEAKSNKEKAHKDLSQLSLFK